MLHHWRLVITRTLLTEALRVMERTHSEWTACEVGFSQRQKGVDWLGRNVLTRWNPSQSALIVSRSPVLRITADAPVATLYVHPGDVPRAYLLHPDGRQAPMPFRLIAPGLPETGMETPITPAQDRERWSRTAGALGSQAWYRLSELHYLIVGCGRNGSMLAHSLVRMGARHLPLTAPEGYQHDEQC